MDWTRAIDSYCERAGPGFWAEPLNAVTNLAFVLAALVMWRRLTAGSGAGRSGAGAVRGGEARAAQRSGLPALLCGLLAVIGIGSGVFHTVAQSWAALADVVPIGLFILTYLFAINRDVIGLRPWQALGATALFLPYAALVGAGFAQVPALGSSATYGPVPVLILLYAAVLRRRAPDLARGFGFGAGLLILSLLARSLDAPLCEALPVGSHFLWHLLNAAMLGWMIEVYRRYCTAPDC